MARKSSDSEVVQREFDPADCNPYVIIPEAVAELEDKDPDELMPLYSRVDDVLEDVFSNPPVPEAEMRVTFRYEGYRITVHYDGRTEFKKV